MAKKITRRNPGEGGSSKFDWGEAGAAFGSYAAVRLAGRIVKQVAGNRPMVRKGGKVAVAVGGLVLAYHLGKKPKFRKYRTAMIAAAIIALVQAAVEEFVPGLGGLLDLGQQGNYLPPAQRQQQEAQGDYVRQLAEGRRTTLRSAEDDEFDRMEAAYYQRHPHQAPQQPAAAAAGGSAGGAAGQANGASEDGPGPEYEEDDDIGGGGIFGPN